MFNNSSTAIRRRAFTLVEILAVIVILGIAAAIIIPQIGTRDDIRVAAAARTVVADLIYAQNLAISTGSPVYVRFDVTNDDYTMLTNPDSGKANFGDFVTQPVTQSNYIQQFGSAASSSQADSWQAVSIQSATFNGIDPTYRPEYTVGFDELGAPYVFNYTNNHSNDLNDGTIVLKCGTFSSTISIAAATGEITVN